MTHVEAITNNKLKILAIHGYRQNAETFRQKTGSFRKVVNKWAEFTFITAPHKVIQDPNAEGTEEEQYGWFFNKEDNSFRGTREGGPAIGFQDSVDLIENVFESKGPFDGIWGFSQGACLVALLCDLQQRGKLKAKFKFAIMVAGFKSGSLPHAEFLTELVEIPTLHVFGDGDQIIPSQMSETLSKCFAQPVIVKHSGGHFVPASADVKGAYQNFFNTQFQMKNVEPSGQS